MSLTDDSDPLIRAAELESTVRHYAHVIKVQREELDRLKRVRVTLDKQLDRFRNMYGDSNQELSIIKELAASNVLRSVAYMAVGKLIEINRWFKQAISRLNRWKIK